MSKTTHFLRNLFTRYGATRKRRRDRRLKSHVEQLENRIAFAVDVVLSNFNDPQQPNEPPNAEEWLTVLANHGSDVFLKMDATRASDLVIADNSSFSTDPESYLNSIPSVDGAETNFDTIYVYNGQRVEQQVSFPNDDNYTSAFGLLPTSYVSELSDAQGLTFLLNTRYIDTSDRIEGSIQIGDAAGSVVRFINLDTDADGLYEDAWQVVNSPNQIDVTFGASGALRTISIASSALTGAGSSSMPILELDYDHSSTLSEARFASSSGLVPPSSESTFKLFNETTHQYVPGVLQGEVSIYFGDYQSLPLSFQVETTGTGTEVPISFGRGLSTSYTGGGQREPEATFLVPIANNTGTGIIGGINTSTIINERFTVRGHFNTETAELSFQTAINNSFLTTNTRPGGPVSLPVVIDNVQIGLRDISPSDDRVDVLGTKFDDLANDLTLFPGGNFTQSVVAELPNTRSEISIENPLLVPNTANGGLVSLAAGKVLIESEVRADGQFFIPSGINTAFGTTTEVVEINRPINSPAIDIRLDDNDSTGNITRSLLHVTPSGSLSSPAGPGPLQNFVYLEIEDGDAFIEGSIVASQHSYVMRSGVESELEGPYVFTTQEKISGDPSGNISGGLLSMLLANDTLGDKFQAYQTMVSTVDIETSIDTLRMQAATRAGHSADLPFPYNISIAESDDLIVDAVAASSGTIDIKTGGDLNLDASINSMGDIKLEVDSEDPEDTFSIGAPISTSFGSIGLTGPNVEVANSVRIYGGAADPLRTDISIEATEGQILIGSSVAAINGVLLKAEGENGKILGNGRLVGDSVEGISTGDVFLRTDASVVSVQTPGVVRLDDNSSVAFEVKDSPDVTLISNGFDDISLQADGAKQLSPALFANVIEASRISVSAPSGSIDLLHSGTVSLEVGDGAAIASGAEADVDVMTAAGSVVIRSNSARDMLVSDAPNATSGATTVRFTTSQPLPKLPVPNDTKFAPSTKPGVYPTYLTATLPKNGNNEVETLGGVNAADINEQDFILLKNGRLLDSVDGVAQISPTSLKMPDSFSASESIIHKRIEGNSLEFGTTVVDYDPDTKILEISKQLLATVNGEDAINIFDDSCNGIYGVQSKEYPSATLVKLTMKRLNDFDTTEELSGRQYFRVTDGAKNGNSSTAGKVFVSDGFSNKTGATSDATPIYVEPVLSRPGFVTANAISTKTLPAELTETGDLVATNDGAIGFAADLFDGVVLGVGRRVLIQSPLADTPDEGTFHYGLYTVASPGSSVEGAETPWRLRRYTGVDENGDGNINQFLTGTVALTQGSLRTAVTGQMYEIGFDSINSADLSFREITDFRKVNTVDGGTYLTEEFNSIDQYRTDIGTRNVLGTVNYQITSEGGRNDDPGSLGRMLSILQGNTAVIDREDTAQLTKTTFHESVQTIQLEQELPEINVPIEIIPNNEIIIDGSRITETRDGAVVRTGSLRARLGPASPSAKPSSRRLVRGPSNALSFDQVNGLEIGPTAGGSVIGNLSIGGFTNGSGVIVFGADHVLLNNIRVGTDVAGNSMPNKFGVQIEQAAGGDSARFTTVRNSVVAANTLANVSIGNNVDGVRLVGNQIGKEFEDDEVGVIVDTGETGLSHVGVQEINSFGDNGQAFFTQITILPSYPSDLSPLQPVPVVVDPLPVSVVSVPKNGSTDFFEPGLELFERLTNRKWTVRSITLSTDESAYVMTIQGPQLSGEDLNTNLSLEAGYFVNAAQRAETLRLPRGVDPARLYLGQQLGSTIADVFETGTYITSITPLTSADGVNESLGDYGGVEVGLSRPIALSAQTGIVFETAGRNDIGFNNEGIILKSGSSKIIATDVFASNHDGIRIEGVAPGGMHMIGGARGTELSTENVSIHSNRISGLSFVESFFADLDLGETPRTRMNQVSVKGNVFGSDMESVSGSEETPPLTNGQRYGFGNIVIGNGSMQQEHQDRTDRDSQTGRYNAKYRPEDNPDQSPELESVEGLDREGNAHYIGDPLDISDRDDTFDGDGTGGWWNKGPSIR